MDLRRYGSIEGFWGKARPKPDAVQRWHPLVYHSLDIAAVGSALLALRPELVRRLARVLGWEPDLLTGLVPFLLVLHDIGKISRPFQAQVPDLWPAKLLGTLEERPSARPRHDAAGLKFLSDYFAECEWDPLI